MERQVFISHATGDPDWTPEAIEALANAIHGAGIGVQLDLWHQKAMKRHLSLGEWRGWMDAAVRGSTYVLCLVSPHYLRLWERRPDDPGGFGVAFESIRLIHGLYLLKQRSYGRILTLRTEGRGYDCIPPDLALDCPAYHWAADRAMLLSHLGEAALPTVTPDAPAPPAPRPPTPPSPAPPAPAAPPRLAWASASGKDQYGDWADLTIHGVTQRMRWIPPTGSEGFWMGSSVAERAAIQDKDYREWANQREHAPRRMQVPAGFWLADTPCTQAFWRAVADIDPSHFSSGTEAPERPVESVSWNNVMEQFITRLAARPIWETGETVCLPTEVEWEYACRAGTRTAYWWGDTPDDTRANWTSQHGGTTPVKRYAPNPWGLYDMHGNVWEWCADAWRERLDAPEARPDDSARVVRGGSWFSHPDFARAAFRFRWRRDFAGRVLGFRFALRSSSRPEAGTRGPEARG